MTTMALGCKISFAPTDSQVIAFIVEDSAPNFIIRDCDLFGREEPWQIWVRFAGFQNPYNPDELYFFIPSLKKVGTKGGSRITQTIGGASWTQKETVKLTCDDESREIGVKRRMRYVNKHSEQNSLWYLDELTCATDSSAIFGSGEMRGN